MSKDRITKEFILVIEEKNKATNENIDLKKLELNLKLISEFYALILHDKDIKNNEQVRPHYHLVIKLNKRMRKMTLINHIAKYNNLQIEMIQADYTENFILSIRYLLHLDNPEKHQYAPFQIITNTPHLVQNIVNEEIYPSEITAKQLIYYVHELNYSATKILEIIGLKNFKSYAYVIKTLIDEYYQNPNKYKQYEKERKER